MQFSNKLDISNGKTLEFNFSPIYTVYGSRYFVTVIEENKEIYKFKMKKDNKQWIIIGTSALPEWIWEIESGLSDIIVNRKS
jgi:hypothetical protein